MRDDALTAYLAAGFEQLQLTLSPEPFVSYLQLLHKWNQAYNLTAIRDVMDMAAKHVLDSLAIMRWIKGPRIIDVGTGAGLPGIPLALACPQYTFTLLDSNGKKTRFLHEVKRVLALEHVSVVQARVETYHFTMGFDTVVSRAFSDISQFLNGTQQFITQDGIWLAMKGQVPEEELRALTYPYQVMTYQVPEVEGQRCCILIQNNKD